MRSIIGIVTTAALASGSPWARPLMATRLPRQHIHSASIARPDLKSGQDGAYNVVEA